MLMRATDEALNQNIDYDVITESEQYRSEWTRILDTAYEYEAAIRAERTAAKESQTIQK